MRPPDVRGLACGLYWFLTQTGPDPVARCDLFVLAHHVDVTEIRGRQAGRQEGGRSVAPFPQISSAALGYGYHVIIDFFFLVGVSAAQVDAKACIAALPDCEPRVLEHCLRTYSVPADDGKDGDGNSNDAASGEVRGAR